MFLRKAMLSAFAFMLVPFTASCGTSNSQSDEKPDEKPVIAQDVDYGASDYMKISPASNALGFELVKQVDPDDQGNIFLSPASIFMALSLAYNGADGTTQSDMAAVMNIGEISLEEFNKANASLLAAIHRSSEDIVLNVANAMWINNKHQFQNTFAEQTGDYFNAETEAIDINDPDSADEINRWVQQATNDHIKQIVEPPLDPSTVALLVNAIYFNGKWMHEFDPKDTKTETFHFPDGSEKDHEFMLLQEELSYFEHEDFQAVTLPYGVGEVSMNIILPKAHINLDAFIAKISGDAWNKWQDQFKSREGTLKLPKFKVDYETSLVEPLQKLGMTAAFQPEKAEFPHMIEDHASLFISDVMHKTYINVNEEGTEAAGVTSVEITETSATVGQPFEMMVNKPFLITITDNDTGANLFIGAIKNPKETN
ncbi:Serpin A12 [Lentibacillus sp. JNUCC-1]|uniref:serpin family protein n=1 Tax=Lentibacillus sp. JNUCC-1 TaxID=2654513 RepID=UPI0012E8B05D|nr:serpin family protein [Lentibacillus sp. JNUCC-1]MUV36742.1 Serpin A12 [Lentibacillus sp. JNUCC-1]